MAVVLMVWVGFLGASLATRQKKHLAVDATDRILSPKVAQMVKRFGALIAAGFCWELGGYSMELVNQSLITGSGQDAVPLWDILKIPVNMLGGFLHPETGNQQSLAFLSGLGLLGLVYAIRLQRDSTIRSALSALGAFLFLLFSLSLFSTQWSPNTKEGAPYVWQELGVEASQEVQKQELEDIGDAKVEDGKTSSLF